MFYEKAWYTLYFGAAVCIEPFLNWHFRTNGLDDAQIGILTALRPWIAAPAAFAWSALADNLQIHQVILLSTFCLSSFGWLGFYFVSSFWSCAALTVLTQAVGAPVAVIADTVVTANCKQDGEYGKVRLWGAVGWGTFSAVSGWLDSMFGIASAFILYFLLSLPCVYLATQLKYSVLLTKQETQVRARSSENGSTDALHLDSDADTRPQRVNSVAEALVVSEYTPLSSASARQGVHHLSRGVPEHVPPILVASEIAPLLHGDASSSQRHQLLDSRHGAAGPGRPDSPGASEPEDDLGGKRVPFWQALHTLLSSGEVLLFMATAITMGFGIGAISYLFLFLDELGGSTTLMGLTLTVTCASEVPAFHYQDRVMAVLGIPVMLHLVMATYVLRLGLYAMLPWFGSPWFVLPIELLHGITFATGWGAGTTHCRNIAPRGLEATMQGIFSGLYFGLGSGVGALSAGFMSKAAGTQAMFAMCAVLVLCAWGAILTTELLRTHGVAAARRLATSVTAWLSTARTGDGRIGAYVPLHAAHHAKTPAMLRVA